MDEAQQVPEPDVGDLHRRLTDRLLRLGRHASALHQSHQPWGLTPYQVQSALLGVPEAARLQVRLDSGRAGRRAATAGALRACATARRGPLAAA